MNYRYKQTQRSKHSTSKGEKRQLRRQSYAIFAALFNRIFHFVFTTCLLNVRRRTFVDITGASQLQMLLLLLMMMMRLIGYACVHNSRRIWRSGVQGSCRRATCKRQVITGCWTTWQRCTGSPTTSAHSPVIRHR